MKFLFRRHSSLCLIIVLGAIFVPLCSAYAADKVRIGFGSCINNPNAPTLDALKAEKLDSFIFLGDSIYLNTPPNADVEAVRRAYDQHFSPNFKLGRFITSLPTYAVWDDHDFGPSDADSSFKGKAATTEVFLTRWPRPKQEPEFVGTVAGTLSFPGVDVFLTDNRSFRVNHGNGPDPVCLGDVQLTWLSRALKSSKAPLKIVTTGNQLLTGKTGFESFADFEQEQKRLIAMLAEEKGKVLVLSGDRHFGVLRSKMVGDRRLFEATSSPLGAPVAPDWIINGERLIRLRQWNDGPLDTYDTYAGLNYGVVEYDPQTGSVEVMLKDQTGKIQLRMAPR